MPPFVSASLLCSEPFVRLAILCFQTWCLLMLRILKILGKFRLRGFLLVAMRDMEECYVLVNIYFFNHCQLDFYISQLNSYITIN